MQIRRERFLWPTLAVGAAVAVAAGGGGSAAAMDHLSSKHAAAASLQINTPAASKSVSSVTWGLYRDVNSVDPIFGFDYPENTVDSALCDALFRQTPSGGRAPGLALKVTSPNPTTDVFTLRPGVKFWDGHPMSSADVVYSLQRAASAKVGGFYSAIFNRVKSISATGRLQVTLKLTQPDQWLLGELSSLPGMIVEKSFAEKAGTKYGTMGVGGMCTGPYMIKSWTAKNGLIAVRNPHYWDRSIHPWVSQYIFKGFSDTAMTSGLETGAIGITYSTDPTILAALQHSTKLSVTRGSSYVTDALIVASQKGPLGNIKVRRALSMALNRAAYIKATYLGGAQMPNTLANPGTWGGYQPAIFQAAYNALPSYNPPQIAAAKKLVQQAGATGKTITIGMSNQITQIQNAATTVEDAAAAIGLNVKLKTFPAATWIDVFTSAKARAGLDAFFVSSYPDYGAPEAQYQQFVLPGGSLNYSGFNDPQITKLLDRSRSTANAAARARLVVQAQKLIMQQLPWIPLSDPDTVLVTQKNLTGAPASFSYMYAPWAAVKLGGR